MGEVGEKFKVRLWPAATLQKVKQGRYESWMQMELFDTVNQDLLIPIFYMNTNNFGWAVGA